MGMRKTHWKNLYDYKYLGSQDLEGGSDKVVKIQSINKEIVTSEGGRKEECTILRFEGVKKPMILNKTNAKIITKVYNSPYIEDWIGQRITLYIDRNIKFRGEIVEGLRIRPKVPKALNDLYASRFKELKALMSKYKGSDLDDIRLELNNHATKKTLTIELLNQYILRVQ